MEQLEMAWSRASHSTDYKVARPAVYAHAVNTYMLDA
jgi:hypothetical protein